MYKHAVHVASCSQGALTAKAMPACTVVSIDCRHDFEIQTHHAEEGGKFRSKLIVRHVRQICLLSFSAAVGRISVEIFGYWFDLATESMAQVQWHTVAVN